MILFVIIGLFCRLLIVKPYKLYCLNLCELLPLFSPPAATASASRRAPPAPDHAQPRHTDTTPSTQRPGPGTTTARQSRRETDTASAPEGERHGAQQTRTDGDGTPQHPAQQPADQPSRSRRQSPSRPARSHPAPPACRPCCTPSRLTESEAGKERGREGKRKEQPRHTLKTAATVIIPNPGPLCARLPSPATWSRRAPVSRTPSTATTPPPFQFCFWRENRTGPQNNPEYTRESGTTSPPRPP